MGLTLYLGIKRGKIACHKSEARFGTLLREGRLASRASRDEAFWRSQVNFGPPNPATDEKALWSKGKCVRCHTPCLPKVPRGRARRSRARQPGSGFPTGRGTGYGHLEAHHDLQATPARPGKATRLGVRGSIVPAAPRTSYSSFLKAGGRDLFSATEKNGADLTRHNLTIHPIPMICA
ncbi:hypothetical protein SLA2020_469580 [Shorea laevis]|uniref:Uncharacterized protein n=1 Tax=Rubroshorea leprosula TaxID=152421 RepID=A0AAV5MS06_9ROSI|nr:hypothetical protein SLEP1_g58911 [Rubroshorea leprosula]